MGQCHTILQANRGYLGVYVYSFWTLCEVLSTLKPSWEIYCLLGLNRASFTKTLRASVDGIQRPVFARVFPFNVAISQSLHHPGFLSSCLLHIYLLFSL